MRYFKIFLLLFFFSSGLYAQLVTIDGIPRDTSFTLHSAYVKALKQYPDIKKVLPALPANVQAIEGIIYSVPVENRNLKLNLYRPQDDNKYPVLLMVHGGGWSSGDLSMQIPMAQQIASHGYVAIPVEYRLSPEAPYPAAVLDLKTAIRWIRANADAYKIDTTHIAISGCSAGGQLAMLVGMTNFQQEYETSGEYPEFRSNVHAVVNIDGISDFSTDEWEATKESLAKKKIPASIKWLGGTYDDKREAWLSASPVHHITKDSAPVCFINSSIPRFHGGRNEAIEILSGYDIYTEVHVVNDTPHPFWLFHPWFDSAVAHTVSFLDKMLKMKKME
ncbi:acetyl esterase/lipase [Dysgonomonas sp. PFB1-18]|uniref:alpha/beta hydrolase n=1 Tax=unclassified Dysgonomonas TaxID=2630389 RepID=UPI002475335D|nr:MULTISPECIES: alpha/beta hydrolase [unclassified Dysgonomonas]MDH6307959.1 acetyl esterase/lipase [Dysgonomonas sp. PF1-14]MDH6339498.1 acetyl esterase/lipase [Dysgonomonas sp. PF1-16]MDH6381149.1 acetyl esterase/lipase [Dysgonomonas sp. PFB1-18]MDH6398361.1 acetyl esterase/lipase [Dysgonomonas sp. PF1-23]